MVGVLARVVGVMRGPRTARRLGFRNQGPRRNLVSSKKRPSTSTLIFGSNTDVGKSLLVSGLCRYSAIEDGRKTGYVKPVQAGLPGDQDMIDLYGEGKVRYLEDDGG